MKFLGDDLSIPRIHVIEEEGKATCLTDSKLQRFGPVFSDGKQGMHLFSVGYCLSSLAVHFGSRTLQNAAEEITETFHTNFMTKLLINSMYRSKGKRTLFKDIWEEYFINLDESFIELGKFLQFCSLKCARHCMDDHYMSLQNYLNFVGSLQHILPCNVIHAENAKDPSGGGKSNAAVQNLKRYNEQTLRESIKDIIDPKVIENIFQKGFDENNTLCLAFIIMQTQELQSLRRNNGFHNLAKYCNLKDYVFDVAHFSILDVSSMFSTAFDNAINQISKAKNFIERNIHKQDAISDKIYELLM